MNNEQIICKCREKIISDGISLNHKDDALERLVVHPAGAIELYTLNKADTENDIYTYDSVINDYSTTIDNFIQDTWFAPVVGYRILKKEGE